MAPITKIHKALSGKRKKAANAHRIEDRRGVNEATAEAHTLRESRYPMARSQLPYAESRVKREREYRKMRDASGRLIRNPRAAVRLAKRKVSAAAKKVAKKIPRGRRI